jgi:hypothetical protein
LPHAKLSSRAAQQVYRLTQVDRRDLYGITIKEVTKPIVGLKISFICNPQTTAWEHCSYAGLHNRTYMVFKFHDKKVMQAISTRSSPLRWYADADMHSRMRNITMRRGARLRGKRQPRIVIDIAHNDFDVRDQPLMCDNQAIKNHVSLLADLLRGYSCEVYLTHNARGVPYGSIMPAVRAGYANMLISADLFIAASAHPEDSATAVQLAHISNLGLTHASMLMPAERDKLDALKRWRARRLTQLGVTESRALTIGLLVEMPALMVRFGGASSGVYKRELRSLAQALASIML